MERYYLAQARRACATREVRQLTDAGGAGSLARILDRVSVAEPQDVDRLTAAIRDVTGEDVDARLGRYQAFSSPAVGLRLYAAQYRAAEISGDLPAALTAVLRQRELSAGVDLRLDCEAAFLLYRMGHEPTGDEFLRQRLAWLKQIVKA